MTAYWSSAGVLTGSRGGILPPHLQSSLSPVASSICAPVRATVTKGPCPWRLAASHHSYLEVLSAPSLDSSSSLPIESRPQEPLVYAHADGRLVSHTI